MPERAEIAGLVDLVTREALAYLDSLDSLPVRSPRSEEAAHSFDSPLPDIGGGASQALQELIQGGMDAALSSSGPRFFHFVMGGSTPAALGADWLATVIDQVAYAWVSSPLAVKLEIVSLNWLKDLLSLPAGWSGVMTTGATMANFVGLAAARQWWGHRHGVDVAQQGLQGLPQVPVFSSGYVHASAVKVLGMLGIGRAAIRILSHDAAGRLDVPALDRALQELDGAPAILIGNAGEVNAGDFDPIATLADLAEEHGAWLHVDGAFGLFARATPLADHLAHGVERADSVTVDGHKWLNVPYDCGFAFVGQQSLLAEAFAYTAAYLPGPEDPRPNMGAIGPESSRRARSLSVWSTLRAYGRTGYREMIERHLALAQRMARLVDEAPELERLAEVPLNIVCFRVNPGSHSEGELDRLNNRLGEALLEDGRVYAGTTDFEGKVALRPAIANWRTREEDIDMFIRIVRELAADLVSAD
ncbi:MAG: aspartate aminotransferase family protein [Gemmatimonadales bacterium]|nr:aspartate aminotransferase family protein [Gemmatimonadales bacterium]